MVRRHSGIYRDRAESRNRLSGESRDERLIRRGEKLRNLENEFLSPERSCVISPLGSIVA